MMKLEKQTQLVEKLTSEKPIASDTPATPVKNETLEILQKVNDEKISVLTKIGKETTVRNVIREDYCLGKFT